MTKRKTEDTRTAALVEEETSVVRERVANTSENTTSIQFGKERVREGQSLTFEDASLTNSIELLNQVVRFNSLRPVPQSQHYSSAG